MCTPINLGFYYKFCDLKPVSFLYQKFRSHLPSADISNSRTTVSFSSEFGVPNPPKAVLSLAGAPRPWFQPLSRRLGERLSDVKTYVSLIKSSRVTG